LIAFIHGSFQSWTFNLKKFEENTAKELFIVINTC